MTHPKVEFQPGVWQDLALKYATGKLCQNSRQPSKLFTTVDGRVFFLSLPEAAKLEALRLAPGDVFSCAKIETVRGLEFECDRIGAPEVVTPRMPVRSEERRATTPAPHYEQASNADQPVALNGNPTKPAAPVAMPARTRTVLEDCLITAVSAVKSAEEWGKANGYTIRFSSEDIRAMAITTAINRREERHAA